jgi:acyl-CoA thioesterase FadM
VGIELVRDDQTMVEGELRYVFVETGGSTKHPIPDSIRERLSAYA